MVSGTAGNGVSTHKPPRSPRTTVFRFLVVQSCLWIVLTVKSDTPLRHLRLLGPLRLVGPGSILGIRSVFSHVLTSRMAYKLHLLDFLVMFEN